MYGHFCYELLPKFRGVGIIAPLLSNRDFLKFLFLAIILKLSLKSNAVFARMYHPLFYDFVVKLFLFSDISSFVPKKWPCDIILSQQNIRLSDHLLLEVMGTMKHEQIAEALIGRISDSKFYPIKGLGGTRFVAMHCSGWIYSKNKGI